MRLSLAAAAAALLLTTAARAAPPGAADRAALENLAARNDSAWTAGDAAAIAADYSADGTLRLAGMAEALEGSKAVRGYFERAFAARPSSFRHVTRLERIDIVGRDIAFADAHVRVEQLKDGKWEAVREFLNHSVLRKERGAWKLHSVRAHRLP